MAKHHMPHIEHKHGAPTSLRFAIVTISTSRFYAKKRGEAGVKDEAGDTIEQLVKKSQQHVTRRDLIADDQRMIRDALAGALSQSDVDVVITTGGTGFSRSDVTVETIRNILDKEMPGFGEIFRKLTYDEIGSPAIMTRALAGVVGCKPVFCLPGSPHAVKLAVEKLILPEAGHLVKLLQE